MAAPAFNRFWEKRSSHGRKPIFATPEDLWTAVQEYFQWVEDSPLQEMKAFSYQGEITKTDLPKMQAMTIGGLCIFLDIDFTTWKAYGEKEGFSHVVKNAEAIIRQQKFVGAAADLLNPNIIARDLGLVDKQVLAGSPDEPIEVKGNGELARMLSFLLQRDAKVGGDNKP